VKFLSFLFAVFLPACFLRTVQADTMTIRLDPEASIHVPVPSGFAVEPVTSQVFKDAQTRIGAEGNDLLVLFSSAADPTRQLNVQVVRSTRGKAATAADLEAVRRTVDQQRETLSKQPEGGTVFEPVHDSSDRHFSFGMNFPEKDGEKVSSVSTTALVNGRLWFVSAKTTRGSDPASVAWVKSTAHSWAASILAANPPAQTPAANPPDKPVPANPPDKRTAPNPSEPNPVASPPPQKPAGGPVKPAAPSGDIGNDTPEPDKNGWLMAAAAVAAVTVVVALILLMLKRKKNGGPGN
jgi:hypothetical protein